MKMKRRLTLIFALFVFSAVNLRAAVYPSTEFIGTNLQKQATAAAALAVLGGVGTNETRAVTVTNAANVLGGNGAAITALSGDNVSSGTVADARIASTLTRDSEFTTPMGYPTQNLAVVAFNNNAVAATNVQSTNIVGQTGLLAASGNQTNYTVPLVLGSGNDALVIKAANTNIFITFTGTNVAYANRTVIVDALTNTVVSRIGFISSVRTNFNVVAWATNGHFKQINFFNPDTTGTNVLVTDGGFYSGPFTQ